MHTPFQSIPLHSTPKHFWSADSFPESFLASSWNLLAPCWKRTSYGREAENHEEWNDRLYRTLEQILQLNSDIICLQELWFEEEYLEKFMEAVGETYMVYTLKRVHNKPDGLAVLIKKNIFPMPKALGFDFNDFGSRVGLVLVWESFVLLNTHLTFPHDNEYDKKIRISQVLDIKSILDEYSTKQQLVVGDLNGSIYDNAVSLLMKEAYLYPMIEHCDFVTHVSHRGDEMACDLFLSSMKCFTDLSIHPIQLSLSDHCIVETRIHVPKDNR